MGNPLLVLLADRSRRVAASRRELRRVAVDIPTDIPGTDAIFFVLRRMRAPLIVIVTAFSISAFGLSLIPGVDSEGREWRMTFFDAFYFVSYMATTIGFGELNYTFTTPQRMWVTVSIYMCVVAWAYAIGALFALHQDGAFQDALAVQRFGRRVRRMREPFLLVAGYGQAGREICRSLDEMGRRFVVVDVQSERIDALGTDQLHADVPGYAGDVRVPAVLGLAGLGHRHCEGVLAVTSSDEANFAVAMTAELLRPDVPVIARCDDRALARLIDDFNPAAVINAYDRYGSYLLLALQRPAAFQLITWLMSPHGTPLPARREGLAAGRWVVWADGRFGHEVAQDLRAAGLDVVEVDKSEHEPDVAGAVGFVAGSDHDTANLRMAAHARLANPDLFVAVRQESNRNGVLLQAFAPDSVFIATDLLARECLARVVTPLYWSIIDHLLHVSDEEAGAMTDRLVRRFGEESPVTRRLEITPEQAPALVRWLRTHELTLGELLSDPDEREERLPAYALALVRGEKFTYDPDLAETLQLGDVLVLAGRTRALDALAETLYYESTVEYLTTGRDVPTTWMWRVLTRQRLSTEEESLRRRREQRSRS